jgi:histidine ammonia-lyase
VVRLDGKRLTCAQVRELARGTVTATVGRPGRQRAAEAARVAAELAASREIYGRGTGVGANRDQKVAAADQAGHGLRLLRSHAGGGGPLIAAELSRAMLVVRVNQIAAGGSGVDPGVLDPLLEVVNSGLAVAVPRYGAIGTGDLTALAVTALCLLGERDWLPSQARQPRFALAPTDALAFLSSNAATVGEAALACADLDELLAAAVVIAALSHRAVTASVEPYAEAVQLAKNYRGQRVVAAMLRGLLADRAGAGGAGAGGAGGARAAGSPAGGRIQDPYGYRALPQVHGPAVDAVAGAGRAVAVELNAAAENPLIDVAGGAVWHNGNFHAAYTGLALDAVRAALFQTAALSAARLGTLVEPAFTGLAPFLATDRAPSSGIMILEYVAHSAVADIRRLAAPAALGSAVLSRGVEEHAGFATQSARATTEVVDAYRIVLACELVAAVRALRLRSLRPGSPVLAMAFELAAAALPADTSDRPLDADLAIAQALLAELSVLSREHSALLRQDVSGLGSDSPQIRNFLAMGLYSRVKYSRALPEIVVDSDPDIDHSSGHLVLFYRDDDEFADRVSEFLRPAIEGDGSAVFIGTAAHRALVQDKLERQGLDLTGTNAADVGGGYLGLDAIETMRRFVVAGWPDPGSFWRVANPLVARPARVAETARNQRPVRIAEETVARLWEAGAVSAAVEVETMWQQLAERHPFALLCGYPARSVAGRHHDAALAQVRRLHDSVLSTSTPRNQAPVTSG